MINLGSPFTSPFSTPFGQVEMPQTPSVMTPQQGSPDDVKSLTRCVNYLADYSGCGLWRMLWPEHVLNAHQKALCQSSSVMVTNPDFYHNVKIVRIQRQATPHQLEFVKFLKNVIQPQFGCRLVYEIDDIIFREDIPDYNKFKFAFESDEIRNTSMEIMNMCDEITVTCDFMKNYYREKTGKREVTVIPNFPPKFWIGNFFDEKRVYNLYQKHKKKPRILYAGSGAHFDVDNKVKQRDDFDHVIDAIIKTRKEFQWVFVGAFPLRLRPYVSNREIEFHPWQQMYSYPQKLHDLEIQMCVAPLQDNNFNKAKSDLKYIEASSFGLPVACQDIDTYKNAPIRFTSGEEMIKKIRETLKDSQRYKNSARKWYQVAEKRFLENDENLDCFLELFRLDYGDPKRVQLGKYNTNI
jgi:glycosyltransferase involved in cell wall biosynthesis